LRKAFLKNDSLKSISQKRLADLESNVQSEILDTLIISAFYGGFDSDIGLSKISSDFYILF